MGHTRLSPSAAHRWANCPASPSEEANYPERKSGPAAIDGTHSHTLLEQCLNMRLRDAEPFLNEELSDHDGKFTVKQDRIERVNVALEYIWKRYDELTTETDLPEIVAEKKLDPGQYMGRNDLRGTGDVQIITSTFIEIIDYKDGMFPVDPEENLQMTLYAIEPVMQHSDPGHMFRVQLTIIQPKLQFKGLEPINSWQTTSTWIREQVGWFQDRAEATDKPDAKHYAGEWCKFCSHTNCAARANNVMKESGISFDNLEKVVELSNTETNELSDDQIQSIIEAAPMLKQMIEVAEKEAMRRFEAGKDIPGLKVVHGRGSKQWGFSDDEIAEKLKKMGVPKTEIYVTKLVSPSKANKLKWVKRNGDEKQLSKRQLDRMNEEYVVKKTGKLTVVSESDHRECVILNASPMFGDVSEPVEDVLPSWLS
jgi:hypothetical protein